MAYPYYTDVALDLPLVLDGSRPGEPSPSRTRGDGLGHQHR
jgi:hypothetical protein